MKTLTRAGSGLRVWPRLLIALFLLTSTYVGVSLKGGDAYKASPVQTATATYCRNAETAQLSQVTACVDKKGQTMRKICIMDIDETLTLFREDKDVIVQDAFARAQGGEHFSTAWAEWNATLVDDIPNMAMVTLYHSLVEQGYTMVVMSARGIANYDVTVEWLRRFGLTYEMLLLRPEELENLGSGPYKEEMINRHLGGFEDIMLAVDDSSSVLKMFTEKGVPTIKP